MVLGPDLGFLCVLKLIVPISAVSFAAEVFSRIGLRDKKRYDLNYLASAQLRLKYDLLYRNLGVLLHDDGHIR